MGWNKMKWMGEMVDFIPQCQVARGEKEGYWVEWGSFH